MYELQAGGGFRGTARQFYDRHRMLVVSVVLSLAGLVTGTTSAMAALQSLSLLDCAGLAVGVVLAAAVCALQTRHLPLAVLSALVPVPGLLWAAPLSAGSEFGAVPVLAYGFGFTVAALSADTRIDRVLGRRRGEPPWRAAAATLVVMAALTLLWHRTPSSSAIVQAVADCALSALSAAVLLPLGATWLHFDEAFIARANREREWLGRMLAWIAHVTVPRWALSFTGIVVVLLALGWFGAAPLLSGNVLLGAESVALVILATAIFGGGWREGLALGLVASAVCLITLWAVVVGSRAVPVGVLEVLALCQFLALHGGRVALGLRRRKEVPVIAQRRMVEQSAGQVFAILGATAVLLPATLVHPGAQVFLIGTLAAAIGAIVFVPAVASAFEVLAPRRRSVEELYSHRKKSAAE